MPTKISFIHLVSRSEDEKTRNANELGCCGIIRHYKALAMGHGMQTLPVHVHTI